MVDAVLPWLLCQQNADSECRRQMSGEGSVPPRYDGAVR